MAATCSRVRVILCWKTRSSLERQAAGGVEVSVRWCLCGYRSDRLWQVPEQVHISAFQTLPFLIDVKLDRTSAPLSERSIVIKEVL